jgi:hypothetical protein
VSIDVDHLLIQARQTMGVAYHAWKLVFSPIDPRLSAIITISQSTSTIYRIAEVAGGVDDGIGAGQG